MFCGTIWAGTLKVTRTSERDYRYTFNGIIYVENQSYNKRVGIRFELGGLWRDFMASYSHSLLTQGGNRVEAWKINNSIHSTHLQSHIRFALFYHNVDWNISHWDNNNGADYFVSVIVS